MTKLTAAEYRILRELRERFLKGTAGLRDYWTSDEHLALYDQTFGERIGWKWDAVLAELRLRGWQPRGTAVLDWGCGSGVAHRRVLAEWPQLSQLSLHDRSGRALRYSRTRAETDFPELAVAGSASPALPGTLLLLSHVINELTPADLRQLVEFCRKVDDIIWVEAGTHADSRRLVEVREALRDQFVPVAPCTHAQSCGMLALANAPHWCHSFAIPPSEIFRDGGWGDFARQMEIDLRSVPYSFLVLTRSAAQEPGWARMVGRPRLAKGYARVLSCQASGVAEFVTQKRDAPEIFRAAGRHELASIWKWQFQDGKIVGGESLARRSSPA